MYFRWIILLVIWHACGSAFAGPTRDTKVLVGQLAIYDGVDAKDGKQFDYDHVVIEFGHRKHISFDQKFSPRILSFLKAHLDKRTVSVIAEAKDISRGVLRMRGAHTFIRPAHYQKFGRGLMRIHADYIELRASVETMPRSSELVVETPLGPDPFTLEGAILDTLAEDHATAVGRFMAAHPSGEYIMLVDYAGPHAFELHQISAIPNRVAAGDDSAMPTQDAPMLISGKAIQQQKETWVLQNALGQKYTVRFPHKVRPSLKLGGEFVLEGFRRRLDFKVPSGEIMRPLACSYLLGEKSAD